MKRFIAAIGLAVSLALAFLAFPALGAIATVVSVGTSATLVSGSGANRAATNTVSLQNLGTQAVFCGFDNTVTTAANFFVVLKAGAGANDGSGGTISIGGGAWSIYCIVAGTTANVAVAVY
jgi:hypothetical protein